jgi:hypothetical protein
MAVLTERYADVLPMLFDMVSVTWAFCVTDNTPHLFDKPKVGFLFGV